MKIHIVQKGDTLWKIAQKYGVDFEELKKMNAQLSNPDMIMPGMKIKVPAGGTAVKKEMHDHKMHGHKEVPKAHPPKKEIVKEVQKEKPHKIYQPVMPQPLPEIDINNYYMMNMSQTQAQVQQQPVKEKEKEKENVHHEESVEMPVEMPVMPVQGGYTQPMYPYCYPVMPICDPCYPYPHHMMPQVQGMAYPQMPMYGQMPMFGQMPMHDQMAMYGQMPMHGQMPQVMPAQEYGGPYPHWDDESPSSSSLGMQHHHGHHHQGFHHGQMMPGMDWDDDPPPVMPMQGYQQQPYGGYPMMPTAPYGGAPMAAPYGGGQAYPYGQPMQGMPMGQFEMPRNNDEEEEDE